MIDIIHDPINVTRPADVAVQPHVVILLDESGSMSSHVTEVVTTFNEYVAKVRKSAKTVSLYTFDSRGVRERIYKEHPDRIAKLTEEHYRPHAMTPLYDAVGIVLEKFMHETRPVQFVAHTDGLENQSVKWTKPALDEFINMLSSKDNNPWLFTWLMEGLEGRQAMQNFAGLKVGMSNATRGKAMDYLSTTTTMYASTADSNPAAYTTEGSDTLDLDNDVDPGKIASNN